MCKIFFDCENGASRLCVGSGTVTCAHGILSVPALATANILEEILYSAGEIEEICTPTGAAILKYFVKEFNVRISWEHMKGIGIGLGKRIFEKPSFLRQGLWIRQSTDKRLQPRVVSTIIRGIYGIRRSWKECISPN